MNKISAKVALSRLQKICSLQEKCIADIMQKLKTWEVPERDSRKIVESLKSEKYIDEERYAVFFVRDKFKISKWGREKIKYALSRKGIDPGIIEEALSEINEENYVDTLRELLLKKKKEIKSENSYEMRGKLIRFGIQRGYSFEIIYRLIDEMIKD